MSREIKYSIEDLSSLDEKYQKIKNAGSELLKECNELVEENSSLIKFLENGDYHLVFGFFDTQFKLEVSVDASQIHNGFGILKTFHYIEEEPGGHYEELTDLKFQFDEACQVQTKDDFFRFNKEAFPYFFVSQLFDHMQHHRFFIEPQEHQPTYL